MKHLSDLLGAVGHLSDDDVHALEWGVALEACCVDVTHTLDGGAQTLDTRCDVALGLIEGVGNVVLERIVVVLRAYAAASRTAVPRLFEGDGGANLVASAVDEGDLAAPQCPLGAEREALALDGVVRSVGTQGAVAGVPVAGDVNHLVRLEGEWLGHVHILYHHVVLERGTKVGCRHHEIWVKVLVVEHALERAASNEVVLLELLPQVARIFYPDPVVVAIGEEGIHVVEVLWHVNHGEVVGDLCAAPWSLDVSKALKVGENVLQIETYNTLANFYRNIPTNYRTTIPSGLIGPVVLKVSDK